MTSLSSRAYTRHFHNNTQTNVNSSSTAKARNRTPSSPPTSSPCLCDVTPSNSDSISIATNARSLLSYSTHELKEVCYKPPAVFQQDWNGFNSNCNSETSPHVLASTHQSVDKSLLNDLDGYRELSCLRQECTRLESRNAQLRHSIVRLKQEHATLTSRIEHLKKMNNQLARENSDYLAQTEENGHLEKDSIEFQCLIRDLSEGLNQKEKAIRRCQEELQRLMSEKDSLEKEKLQSTFASIHVSKQLEELTVQRQHLQVFKEDLHKKKVYVSRLQAMKGIARVFVKLKEDTSPLTMVVENAHKPLTCPTEDKIIFKPTPGSSSNQEVQSFHCNRIFSGNESNENFLQEISPYLRMSLTGYNVCLLTYGETCSGKSRCLIGETPSLDDGLILQSFGMLLEEAEKEKSKKYKFLISFLEIHQETLHCLLSQSKVQFRDLGSTISISGQREENVCSLSRMRELLLMANQRCGAASITKQNKKPGRTHFVLVVKIISKSVFYEGVCRNVLLLVDTAGFDKTQDMKHSRFSPYRSDAFFINKSLTALQNVFECLHSGEKSPPFRTSLLTHFLKPCFTGDAVCVLILTVINHYQNVPGILQTLRFGDLAMNTVIGVPMCAQEQQELIDEDADKLAKIKS